MPKTRHKARSDGALFQCETVAHAGDVWSFLFMDSRVRAVSMLSSQARRPESGEPLMPSVIPHARRFGKRKSPLADGRRLRHGNERVGVGWMVMFCLFAGPRAAQRVMEQAPFQPRKRMQFRENGSGWAGTGCRRMVNFCAYWSIFVHTVTAAAGRPAPVFSRFLVCPRATLPSPGPVAKEKRSRAEKKRAPCRVRWRP